MTRKPTGDTKREAAQDDAQANVAQPNVAREHATDATDANDATDAKDAKKERVLHTRVPAVLEQELKRFADNLRIPVSNLVRTILEDALDVADAATENVETRLKNAAKQLETERTRLKERVRINPLKGVFAFQEVTLAQSTSCARCHKDLPPGSRAHLGLTDESAGKKPPRIFVCDVCLPKGELP